MERILTGNHSLLKNLNTKGILNLIRTKAPISGSNLAKIADMRLSAVHNILINLDKKGLVLKRDTGDSTKLGGRWPTLWMVCGHYGYIVGIQLEINWIQAVLIYLDSTKKGKIVGEENWNLLVCAQILINFN